MREDAGEWVALPDAAIKLLRTPDAVRSLMRRDVTVRKLFKRFGGRWWLTPERLNQLSERLSSAKGVSSADTLATGGEPVKA